MIPFRGDRQIQSHHPGGWFFLFPATRSENKFSFLSPENKKPRWRGGIGFAEREGFEPPEVLPSTVFKTAAIDHSAISPLQKYTFFKIQLKYRRHFPFPCGTARFPKNPIFAPFEQPFVDNIDLYLGREERFVYF